MLPGHPCWIGRVKTAISPLEALPHTVSVRSAPLDVAGFTAPRTLSDCRRVRPSPFRFSKFTPFPSSHRPPPSDFPLFKISKFPPFPSSVLRHPTFRFSKFQKFRFFRPPSSSSSIRLSAFQNFRISKFPLFPSTSSARRPPSELDSLI